MAVIPKAGANKAKSGNVQRSISPGFDLEEFPDSFHLRVEDPVSVHGALGRPGASTGEEDRRRPIRVGRLGGVSLMISVFQCRSTRDSQVIESLHTEQTTPPTPWRHEDDLTQRFASPAEDPSRPHGFRNPDEHLGLSLATTLGQAAQADARVDQDRHDARLEHGEDQREEIQARPHHHDSPGAGRNADRSQSVSDLVTIPIELTIGQVRVPDPTRPIASCGHDDRQSVGFPPGHRAQVVSDIRRLGECRG